LPTPFHRGTSQSNYIEGFGVDPGTQPQTGPGLQTQPIDSGTFSLFTSGFKK
jgi:hypothetical protein